MIPSEVPGVRMRPRIEPLEMDSVNGKSFELLGELAGRGTPPARVIVSVPALLRGHGDEQLANAGGLVSLQLPTGALNLLAGPEPDARLTTPTERSAA